MRCIDKGIKHSEFANYREAMPYLADRLGWFCSYCEMEISNEPDVEHVQPKSMGGSVNLLENLLLSCKKCNKIKSNNNPNRNYHLWPDEDNTFAAYEYYNEIYVRPSAAIVGSPMEQFAKNTLELTGINRLPQMVQNPSKDIRKDPRWQKRKIAWNIAERALANWNNNPSNELCLTIAELAYATGFYSIWLQKFIGNTEILSAIKTQFHGTYEPIISPDGGFLLRTLTSRF
jgi:hypothetical protein